MRMGKKIKRAQLKSERLRSVRCAAYVILDVDVIHAFVVEFLLHVGDGSIVPWDSVDPCVLQTSLLH